MKSIRVQVTVPTVTSETLVTVDLNDYGLSDEQIAMVRKARLVDFETSAGAKKALAAGTATISGDDLAIGEPTAGFVTGDVLVVDLELEELPNVAGVASTP